LAVYDSGTFIVKIVGR